MVPQLWVGKHRPERFVAAAPFGWIRYQLREFNRVP
jgi:hypothetical protein